MIRLHVSGRKGFELQKEQVQLMLELNPPEVESSDPDDKVRSSLAAPPPPAQGGGRGGELTMREWCARLRELGREARRTNRD